MRGHIKRRFTHSCPSLRAQTLTYIEPFPTLFLLLPFFHFLQFRSSTSNSNRSHHHHHHHLLHNLSPLPPPPPSVLNKFSLSSSSHRLIRLRLDYPSSSSPYNSKSSLIISSFRFLRIFIDSTPFFRLHRSLGTCYLAFASGSRFSFFCVAVRQKNVNNLHTT